MQECFGYHRSMKDGPDIARIAALIGDPARANVLGALMDGRALTVTELAGAAGVTLPTVSAHLAKLQAGGLVAARKAGRHKYFALAGDEVAAILEALMGFAAAKGHLRTRTGPRDPALRAARVCYNHLAGEAGIRLYDSLIARGFLRIGTKGLDLTEAGRGFVLSLGLPAADLGPGRTALCRECLDWSARRSHLAGRLGRGLFDHMAGMGWLARVPGSRVVRFTPKGRARFDAAFPVG